MRGGHQHTCQCFEVSASFDHLSMLPRLVTRLCISASGGSSLPGLPAHSVLFTSTFSSILKMLALIVATEIQLFLNENHVRFPTRSGCTHRKAPPGDYFNGILNTDLPDLPLIVSNIRIRHTSVKMARLTNFDRKGVQICFTNNPLTLKM